MASLTIESAFSDKLLAMGMSDREFYVIIERDEDGYYVGEVPQLRACYSQGSTLDELITNIREVIELCLKVLRSCQWLTAREIGLLKR